MKTLVIKFCGYMLQNFFTKAAILCLISPQIQQETRVLSSITFKDNLLGTQVFTTVMHPLTQ